MGVHLGIAKNRYKKIEIIVILESEVNIASIIRINIIGLFFSINVKINADARQNNPNLNGIPNVPYLPTNGRFFHQLLNHNLSQALLENE